MHEDYGLHASYALPLILLLSLGLQCNLCLLVAQ